VIRWKVYWPFRGTFRLNLQISRVSQARYQHKLGGKHNSATRRCVPEGIHFNSFLCCAELQHKISQERTVWILYYYTTTWTFFLPPRKFNTSCDTFHLYLGSVRFKSWPDTDYLDWEILVTFSNPYRQMPRRNVPSRYKPEHYHLINLLALRWHQRVELVARPGIYKLSSSEWVVRPFHSSAPALLIDDPRSIYHYLSHSVQIVPELDSWVQESTHITGLQNDSKYRRWL
jgi:hypothetical protein